MPAALQPASEADVVDAVLGALSKGERLEISAGRTKTGIGRVVSATTLSMKALQGVVDYDPAELILTVLPGTELREIDALLAARRQMLAFDPFDPSPWFRRTEGSATIGGTIAAAMSGSRRVSAGAARDHLLGFRAVSGRGEAFVGGAKVVKNVTGYDLPKLVTGSWGRLCVLTEVTLKVLPRPEMAASVYLIGLEPVAAVEAMALAMGSRAEVACAAYLPERAGCRSITAMRIEGFEPSVRARKAMLCEVLARYGSPELPTAQDATHFWESLRSLQPLGTGASLWRVNVAPSRGPAIAAVAIETGACWLMDWAGGLIWMSTNDSQDAIRQAALRAGGHATLMRASDEMRQRIPALQPQPAPLAALEERVRRAFDPAGVFETGRF